MNGERKLRIAWLGEADDHRGGVPRMGALLLNGILKHSAQVDWYTSAPEAETPEGLVGQPNFKLIRDHSRWKWGRWYSKTPIRAFFSGLIARRRAHVRMSRRIIEEHRARPYDVIFQLSQTELFNLGKHRHELPPIVIHPCSHSAGELRWHRKESAYALQSENRFMHYFVRTFLAFRAMVQKRELKKPSLIIGPSKRFIELLGQDYGVESQRLAVLRHPVILDGDQKEPSNSPAHTPVRALFISRISVRKGFEQIAALSHRMDDLAGRFEIHVIGDRTMWSNYMGHLGSLNPRIARYMGKVAFEKIAEMYRDADMLLVPSMYEPGSLVVGEALAHGLPIVASNEVGPTEVLSRQVCRTFSAGDVDAFESQVRKLLDDLQENTPVLRRAAIEQAKTHFTPDKIAGELRKLLQMAVDRRRGVVTAETTVPAETSVPGIA